MTTTGFTEFTDRIKRLVETQQGSLAPDGDWDPCAFIETEDGQMIVAMMLVEKHQILPFLRQMVTKERAAQIGIVFTAWTVSLDRNDPDAIAEYHAWRAAGHDLSEHPNRREVVLLDFGTATHAETWSADLTRHADRGPTLGEWELSPDETTGLMASLAHRAFPGVRA